MLKRVLTLVSVSVSMIILVFVVIIFQISIEEGVFINSATNQLDFTSSPLPLMLLIFSIMTFIGLILTGLSYSKKKKLFLIVGTLFLLFASVPNVIVMLGSATAKSDPFLLSKLILAPVIVNLINMYTFDSKITNTEGVGKSILSKKKK